MSFRVVHDTEATAEFRKAVAWYEEQVQGLGVRFVLEVDKLMAAISSQPHRFAKATLNNRKAKVLGWPYSIYFVVNEAHHEVKVIAVWHGRRSPDALLKRLK